MIQLLELHQHLLHPFFDALGGAAVHLVPCSIVHLPQHPGIEAVGPIVQAALLVQIVIPAVTGRIGDDRAYTLSLCLHLDRELFVHTVQPCPILLGEDIVIGSGGTPWLWCGVPCFRDEQICHNFLLFFCFFIGYHKSPRIVRTQRPRIVKTGDRNA